MTVKEFLKTNPLINVSAVAKLMWPDNADAPAYLLRKLSDNGARPFTDGDANKALKVIESLEIEIKGLTVK